jgi:predicted nucleotidyltransferase
MSLEELSSRLNKTWPAIAKARKDADQQIERIRELVRNAARAEGTIDSEDISIVVFGSMARREWTSGSDLDWTLLIDGQADHRHAQAGHRMTALVEGAGYNAPGPTGTFGKVTFSHGLIHQIGGQDDTNQNTTQRMLLLLKSHPVNRGEAHKRVVRGILARYVENDFRKFRLKVPRFLLNDLHRFWRTMCVDYAMKYRERAAQGWAIRNIKLRMSRKLIFAAGLIMCFSCDPEWVADHDAELHRNQTAEELGRYVEEFTRQTPLDILAEVPAKHAKEDNVAAILDTYDYFLGQLDDEDVRRHLKELPPERAASDQKYQAIQARCNDFEKALERLFFDDDPRLSRLTRAYGVF